MRHDGAHRRIPSASEDREAAGRELTVAGPSRSCAKPSIAACSDHPIHCGTEEFVPLRTRPDFIELFKELLDAQDSRDR